MSNPAVNVNIVSNVREQFAFFFTELSSNLADAMNVAGLAIESGAKKNVIRNDGVDTGNLLNSIGSRVLVEDEKVTLQVGSSAGYAQAYEFGTAGGAADTAGPRFETAIREWAERKGFPEYAEAIIDHIRKNGTKPHPFLLPAWEQQKEKIVPTIQRAIRLTIKETSRRGTR